MSKAPFDCANCGHEHSGIALGYICIGCPCEVRPAGFPPSNPTPWRAPGEQGACEDHEAAVKKMDRSALEMLEAVEALSELLANLPGCMADELGFAFDDLPPPMVCEHHATYDTGYRMPICDRHAKQLPERMRVSTLEREYPYANALRKVVELLADAKPAD